MIYMKKVFFMGEDENVKVYFEDGSTLIFEYYQDPTWNLEEQMFYYYKEEIVDGMKKVSEISIPISRIKKIEKYSWHPIKDDES